MNKPYNKLNQNDKDIIISNYYNNVDLNFKELASICNVSERAFSRVLKENNINTKLKNRYIIKNESNPTKSSLSNADEIRAEKFISKIKIIGNMFGYKLFISLVDTNDKDNQR